MPQDANMEKRRRSDRLLAIDPRFLVVTIVFTQNHTEVKVASEKNYKTLAKRPDTWAKRLSMLANRKKAKTTAHFGIQ